MSKYKTIEFFKEYGIKVRMNDIRSISVDSKLLADTLNTNEIKDYWNRYLSKRIQFNEVEVRKIIVRRLATEYSEKRKTTILLLTIGGFLICILFYLFLILTAKKNGLY